MFRTGKCIESGHYPIYSHSTNQCSLTSLTSILLPGSILSMHKGWNIIALKNVMELWGWCTNFNISSTEILEVYVTYKCGRLDQILLLAC